MSNLRWILLFSGFAILILLYFSGRPSRTNSRARKAVNDSNDDLGLEPDGLAPGEFAPGEFAKMDAGSVNSNGGAGAVHDPHVHDSHVQMASNEEMLTAYYDDPSNGSASMSDQTVARSTVAHSRMASAPPADYESGYESAHYATPDQQQAVYADEPAVVDGYYSERGGAQQQTYDAAAVADQGYTAQVARPSSFQHGVPPMPQSTDHFNPAEGFGPIDPSDLDRPAATGEDFQHTRDEIQRSVTKSDSESDGSSFTNPIAQKISAFTARLGSRKGRRAEQNSAASHASNSSGGASQQNASGESDKIVLLHVMTPNNSLIDGQLLFDVLQSRGYHYGDLNIFHSLHEGQTVFSIAKVVEPGHFDVNDLSSFETPGLALILRLPGPVPGDVAFEVLMSEASELAGALGCKVLDSGRSTLSRQTVQHIRESILDYMHRQRFLAKATV